MKRTFLLMLIAVISASMGYSQTKYQAVQYYNQCVSAVGTEKLTPAYKCYLECVSIINTMNSNDQSYFDAKKMLLEIWPVLFNGAAHYQGKSSEKFLQFAEAYIDVPNLKCFEETNMKTDPKYQQVVHNIAANSYNSKNYQKAVKYLEYYLKVQSSNTNFHFLADSYKNLGMYSDALKTIDRGLVKYPNDYQLCVDGISISQADKNDVKLQSYLDRALKLRPNEEALLVIQGELYEKNNQYQKAYSTYLRLQSVKPNNVNVIKKVAINCYNVGVLHYNNNELSLANSYFKKALPSFDAVLGYDPTSVMFLEGLATIYQCLGDVKQMEAVNATIKKYGGNEVSLTSVPTLRTTSKQPETMVASVPNHTDREPGVIIPTYSEYAEKYVNEKLKEWARKSNYETLAEHKQRVNPTSIEGKKVEFLGEAKSTYLSKYVDNSNLYKMSLLPYDAENEVFLAESDYGEIVIPVPRSNNEARIFESYWKSMDFVSPEYNIVNDKIRLTKLIVVTPSGKRYYYDAKADIEYTETTVNVNYNDFVYDQYSASNNEVYSNMSKHTKRSVSTGLSDVDINIPQSRAVNDNTYAIIIANENYSELSDVPMAGNDGRVFKEYCQKTLGIPDENITYIANATFGPLVTAISDFKDLAKFSGPENMNLIFYYAGHGIPDEKTRDGYIIPVDADGKNMNICYSLTKLYQELGSMQLNNIYVFLDACFSGANRNNEMLISARAVQVKPRPAEPVGKMVILTATSDSETALAYEDKGHGLFTYYLLKKLQETKGNVTMGELYDYVKHNVGVQSRKINHKLQTPHFMVSFRLKEVWRDYKLVEK